MMNLHDGPHHRTLAPSCCSRVIWLSDADASKGFTVDFTAISMHAVMTDPSPCLYLQLDRDEDEEFFGAGNVDDDGDDEGAEEVGEELPLPELRLVPAAPDTREWVGRAVQCSQWVHWGGWIWVRVYMLGACKRVSWEWLEVFGEELGCHSGPVASCFRCVAVMAPCCCN